MQFICIERCLGESLGRHLPLLHLTVCFTFRTWFSFLSVLDLLLEPIYIIGLLHYNLDSGTCHVQLVVNCMKELGFGVNAKFLAAFP